MKHGRMRRGLVLALIAAVSFAVAGETLARLTANTAVRYMLLDKQLHCLQADGFTIGLCRNVNLHLVHPRGFDYRISTNGRGERRASDLLSYIGPGKPVWVLGDSIAMGFGVHDAENFPFLLARSTGRPVANLGVDGLGARAVLMQFRRALRERKPPALVLRIVHPSDFADDERDEKYASSFMRAGLFRAHFKLARYSAAYNWMRWLVKYRHVRPVSAHAPAAAAAKRKQDAKPKKDATPPSAPAAPVPAATDTRHPTFQYTKLLIQEAKRAAVPLVFVLYPAWDGSTGLPRNDYRDLRGLPAFIRREGGRALDLGAAFRRAPNPGALYIPGDGHPSADAAKVFLKELLPFVPD